MASQHDNPKRWRPRFSVRTLVIVVTLVCAYAACWGPTKTRGVREVRRQIQVLDWALRAKTLAPLVVEAEEKEFLGTQVFGDTYFTKFGEPRRCYYFWFFGYVAKLPYEREI
ncbi:MAG TPA: hypothetical protein VMM76_16580 [Pirellulaceae bacterium]|nr:hypothetical protein [Pirellulaceae bacterium]